ncbi:unnamed protein product [Phytophthora lilii]|uniref:Unnamed protein product n=1 Tax=Phytophthora lilii TaxID=2077276 RepID=A0A9W6T8Z9_9STRA|nr:unnamed protein product [Phytophthora lilii]
MNRSEGCTDAAMDGAAANGNLAMLQWLHENATVLCTTKAMLPAAHIGRLDIITWLHVHYLHTYTAKAITKAAGQGHLKVVKWLHQNHSNEFVERAIKKAAAEGHLHVIQWLLVYCIKPSTLLAAMKQAISSEYYDVMLILIAHVAGRYRNNDLREMICHWFEYQDIQYWFDEKYPPSDEGARRPV